MIRTGLRVAANSGLEKLWVEKRHGFSTFQVAVDDCQESKACCLLRQAAKCGTDSEGPRSYAPAPISPRAHAIHRLVAAQDQEVAAHCRGAIEVGGVTGEFVGA